MKEEADKVNAADGMIFQSEKQLKEYGDKLPADKKSTIENALNSLKTAHAAKDIAGIDAAMASINSAWEAASQEMYAAMNAQQQGGATADASQANPDAGKTENVTDVDYEEVK